MTVVMMEIPLQPHIRIPHQEFPNHTFFVMTSKRSNPSSVLTERKKPFLYHTFRCPRPDCNKSFKTVNGLRMHFGKSPTCASFKMSQNQSLFVPASKPSALDAQESTTEYPWDDDDLQSAESSQEDNISPEPPNHEAGVYTSTRLVDV
jgi:hypothetical protein